MINLIPSKVESKEESSIIEYESKNQKEGKTFVDKKKLKQDQKKQKCEEKYKKKEEKKERKDKLTKSNKSNIDSEEDIEEEVFTKLNKKSDCDSQKSDISDENAKGLDIDIFDLLKEDPELRENSKVNTKKNKKRNK